MTCQTQTGKTGRSAGRCPRISPTAQGGSGCVPAPPLAAEPHPIAYVSKLKQTLKPIKCILVDWIKGKCGAFLLSFAFLLFQYSVFIFGREGLFYSVFGLESAALTVNFLWFIPGIWPALCGFPHQSGIPPCFLKSLGNIWGVRLRKPAVKGCTTYSCPQVTHWESWLELWGKRSQVIPTSWLSK